MNKHPYAGNGSVCETCGLVWDSHYYLNPEPEIGTRLQQEMRDAGERLAAARLAEAEAFLLAKAREPKTTDGHAQRMAIVDTQAELDRAEAAFWLAKCRLLALAEGNF